MIYVDDFSYSIFEFPTGAGVRDPLRQPPLRRRVRGALMIMIMIVVVVVVVLVLVLVLVLLQIVITITMITVIAIMTVIAITARVGARPEDRRRPQAPAEYFFLTHVCISLSLDI